MNALRAYALVMYCAWDFIFQFRSFFPSWTPVNAKRREIAKMGPIRLFLFTLMMTCLALAMWGVIIYFIFLLAQQNGNSIMSTDRSQWLSKKYIGIYIAIIGGLIILRGFIYWWSANGGPKIGEASNKKWLLYSTIGALTSVAGSYIYTGHW